MNTVSQVGRDSLQLLPGKSIEDYARNEVLYNVEQSSKGLYLVLRGLVIVSSSMLGQTIVEEVYGVEDLFGQSGLLPGAVCSQTAVACCNGTKVMLWTAAELLELCNEHHKLGMSLFRCQAHRLEEIKDRIANLATYKVPQRVAIALLRLANRVGLQNDGYSLVKGLSHQNIANYVGTCREVVTRQIEEFHKLGFMESGRLWFLIYTDLVREWLRQNS